MPDYQKGKIYKIISSSHPELRYYGSTCGSLNKRFTLHKYDYINNPGNCSSAEILKYGDAKIKLLEDYPCNSLSDLTLRENKYIKKYKCVNKYFANRSKKEYYKDNIDKLKNKAKDYYYDNQESVKKKVKIYSELNKEIIKEKIKKSHVECECGGAYDIKHRSRHFRSDKHINFVK